MQYIDIFRVGIPFLALFMSVVYGYMENTLPDSKGFNPNTITAAEMKAIRDRVTIKRALLLLRWTILILILSCIHWSYSAVIMLLMPANGYHAGMFVKDLRKTGLAELFKKEVTRPLFARCLTSALLYIVAYLGVMFFLSI